MKVGLVSIWCNRGQATVTRHLRSALETLGHDTTVLARPTRAGPEKSPMLSREDVWDQPGIYEADEYFISRDNYADWLQKEKPDAVFFDQNYQFDEVAWMRDHGVLTIGRFVWERFEVAHVEEAQRALDCVFSLTRCERERYAEMGIATPYVAWGCHPETLSEPKLGADGTLRFFCPASDQRKWLADVVDAFELAAPANAKLVVKTQSVRRDIDQTLVDRSFVEHIADDLSFAEYHALMSTCHVCIAPSKWEGLGLHVYEALSHGLPLIAIDAPPVNEPVKNGVSAVLVPGRAVEVSPSGISGYRASVSDLATAIRTLADRDAWARFGAQTLEQRSRRSWDRTVRDVKSLIDGAIAGRASSGGAA